MSLHLYEHFEGKWNCCVSEHPEWPASFKQTNKPLRHKIPHFEMNKCFNQFFCYFPYFPVLKEEPDDLAQFSGSTSSAASTPSSMSPVGNNNDNKNNCGLDTNVNLNQLNDSCVPPLDDSAPLFGEIFDELILPDGYTTLLSDDIGSLDSQSSKINIDPFMNYRDDSCDTIGTPNLLSPDSFSKVSFV